MDLVRFRDGVTHEDVEAAMTDFGALQELIDEQHGSSVTVDPGETAVLNAELQPGLHGMACFIPTAEGVPHIAEGMAELFDVS